VFELYAAIWRVSGPRQIILIVLSFAVAALAAVPLSYQKDIINGLTDMSLDLTGLLWLCIGMIAMVLLSLALKWLLGYRSSTLGEDIIRLLRKRLYSEASAHRGNDEDHIPAGTLATMVSAEAEELGKFTGSAFSEPVVQIGTLISVIGYIASTQPGLGGIALAMIAPQVLIVLATQGQVNRLVAERVRILRRSSNTIAAPEIRELQQTVIEDFDRIYQARRSMFIWKLSTKFVLSAINGAGTVAVLLLGGWLVLNGRTDVGTVVAATIGLGRLQGPTAFLIAFYRQVSATRVKFDLLREVSNVRAKG
jgi:ABC-type bacteriocin/lantibiotic exporter with double-glycine peptidase domain